MARVSKLALGMISLARGIHSSPNFFFISFARPASISCEECVCIHISDCVEIVHEIPLLTNNSASEICLHKSEAVWLDDWICIIGAPAWPLLMRIRDFGQNVLQSSFWIGISSSANYCHIFFLIAFLEKTFTRNIINIYLIFNYNML